MKSELLYHYFVSFAANVNGLPALGSTEYTTPTKISSFEDIKELCEYIAKSHEIDDSSNPPIILNYNLIREEPY